MKVRELLLVLGVENANEFKKEINSAEDQVGELVTSLGMLVKGLAAVGTAFAAYATAIGAITLRTAEFSETVQRNAAAFATTAEEYQKFQFAFDALGASTDDMIDALATLTDRVVDAAEGSKTYRKELERMGLEVDKIKDKKPGEMFKDFIFAAANVTDETAKMTAVVRLFGDDLGRRIAPALVSGSNSFLRFFQAAEETGIIIEESLVKQGRDAFFSFRLLQATVVGLSRRFGALLAPALQSVSDAMFDWFKINGKLIRSRLDKWTERIIDNVEMFLIFMGDLNAEIGGVEGWIKLFKAFFAIVKALAFTMGSMVFTRFALALGRSILSLKKLFALVGVTGAASFGKFAALAGIIAVALVGIVLAAQDLYGFLKGQDSLIGRLFDGFEGDDNLFGALVEGIRGGIVEVFRWKNSFDDLAGSIVDFINEFGFNFENVWDAALAAGIVFLGLGTDLFSSLTLWSTRAMKSLRLILGILTAVKRNISDTIGLIKGRVSLEQFLMKKKRDFGMVRGLIANVANEDDARTTGSIATSSFLSPRARDQILGIARPGEGSVDRSSSTQFGEGSIVIQMNGSGSTAQDAKNLADSLFGEIGRQLQSAASGGER